LFKVIIKKTRKSPILDSFKSMVKCLLLGLNEGIIETAQEGSIGVLLS